MKLRVLDMLQCPLSGGELHLADAAGSEATPVEEARAPRPCRRCRIYESAPHIAANIEPGDCDACDRIEIDDGRLESDGGYTFPIEAGVPRLMPDRAAIAGSKADQQLRDKSRAGRTIGASFGREWHHFDHTTNRTWHQSVRERCALFLQEVDCTAEEINDQWLLDVGCGNGSLSRGLADMGCDVLASDVADSIDTAYQYYRARGNDRVHFVQADLLNPPFRHHAFDIVYASGVLHHNPDTREAFKIVGQAVAEGGKIYIWVYHRETGLKFNLQLKLRSIISPLPAPLKHGFVRAWAVQAMARQHLRTLLGLNDESDRLTWRERLVDLLDIYTPRYRWMHSQDEVMRWYHELGFYDIKVTEVRDWGFGVVGTKQPVANSAALSYAAK